MSKTRLKIAKISKEPDKRSIKSASEKVLMLTPKETKKFNKTLFKMKKGKYYTLAISH